MTLEEFSNEFDTLIDTFQNTASFGTDAYGQTRLDEYEKSIYLTMAQEKVVQQLYSGKNVFRESFEVTEELKRQLNELVKTAKLETPIEGLGLATNSVFYELPEDVWYLTFEGIFIDNPIDICNTDLIQVIPITQDEFHRVKKNPFRGLNKRRALRLDVSNHTVEIISSHNILYYLIRYISKPHPIILEDLPEHLSIDNQSIKAECRLNPIIHRTILVEAVQLALKDRFIKSNNNT